MADVGNMVTLKGRLVRDPEFNEEHGLLRFSIARDNAGREGGQVASGFFDVVAWTKPSEFTAAASTKRILEAYKDSSLSKGALVEITGRLEQSRWEKDGTKHSRVAIVAESVFVAFNKNRDANKSTTTASEGGEAATSGGDDEGAYVAF